jgi:hypothetical protein
VPDGVSDGVGVPVPDRVPVPVPVGVRVGVPVGVLVGVPVPVADGGGAGQVEKPGPVAVAHARHDACEVNAAPPVEYVPAWQGVCTMLRGGHQEPAGHTKDHEHAKPDVGAGAPYGHTAEFPTDETVLGPKPPVGAEPVQIGLHDMQPHPSVSDRRDQQPPAHGGFA